jgi:hypothetical protein
MSKSTTNMSCSYCDTTALDRLLRNSRVLTTALLLHILVTEYLVEYIR